MDTNTYSLSTIGIAHTPYKQKFGIPKQPSLIPELQGSIEILSPYNRIEAFRGLEGFSHIWVSFVFHQIQQQVWRPMVRPPRLGGNKKVGVFASRSTYRPNPLGLSVIKLDKIENQDGKLKLIISGHDLLDQTPVVDIKPYLPYVDSVPGASDGYAPAMTGSLLEVHFNADASRFAKKWSDIAQINLEQQLIAILQHDPRPAYSKEDLSKQSYGMRLYDLEIQFEIENNCVKVHEIRCN